MRNSTEMSPDEFHQKIGVYGLQMYDESMKAKLSAFLDNVVFAPTDEVFDTSAKESKKDQVKLPLISFFRSGFSLQGTLKNAPEMTGQGRVLSPLERAQYRAAQEKGLQPDDIIGKVRESLKSHPSGPTVNSIPTSLRYQIEVWGRRRDVVDDLVCNLIFLLSMEPMLTIEHPLTGEQLRLSLQLEDEVVDNSEEDVTNVGKVVRMTLNAVLDASRIFMIRETPYVLYPSVQFEFIPYNINESEDH